MFSENGCLLCLEHISDPIGQIDINDAESSKRSVREIVELYFKEQLSAALANATTQLLCRLCWESISNFHQFCERVRAAHQAALTLLQSSGPLKMEIDEEPIKLEPAAEDVFAAPLKERRRGRLRKEQKEATKEVSQIAQMKECKVQLERLKMPLEKGIKQESFNELDEPLIDDASVGSFAAAFDADFSISSADEDKEFDMPLAALAKSKKPKKVKTKKSNASKVESTAQKKRLADTLNSKEAEDFVRNHFRLSCCRCEMSEQLFDTFTDLKRHFREVHRERGFVTCCNKRFLKRILLVDHLRVHQNPDYFKCEQCGKVMSTRNSLYMHRLNHNGPTERVFQCNVCSKSFYRQLNLQHHMLTHVPKEQCSFHCPQCDKSFATNFLMLNHVNLIHLRKYNKICDICGKSVIGGEQMRRHMDEHAGIAKPPIKCDLCGTVVKTEALLKGHKRRLHRVDVPGPHPCDGCDKVFDSLRRYIVHKNYCHKARNHPCTVCDKAFRRPKELREHMTTHTGEDLYSCPYCTQTFKSNANMYSHRKKKHYNEWLEERLRREQNLQERMETVPQVVAERAIN